MNRLSRDGLMQLIVVGMLSLCLSGCGFHPMMGANAEQDGVSSQLCTVEVSELPNRDGQQLRNFLIDRLCSRPAQTPKYTLHVRVISSEEPLAISKDSSSSSAQISSSATFSLVHLKSGKVALAGVSRVIPSYNITNYQWASLVAQQSANQRSIEYLCGEIITKISLYFARNADQRPLSASD